MIFKKKKIIYRTPIQSKTVYPCKLWFYLILLTNQNLITPSCIAYSLSVLKDGEQLHRSEIHTKYVFDGPSILLSFLCMIKTNLTKTILYKCAVSPDSLGCGNFVHTWIYIP